MHTNTDIQVDRHTNRQTYRPVSLLGSSRHHVRQRHVVAAAPRAHAQVRPHNVAAVATRHVERRRRDLGTCVDQYILRRLVCGRARQNV